VQAHRSVLVRRAPPLAAEEGPTEDAKLELFFRAFLDQTFRAPPSTVTRLGDHWFRRRVLALRRN
jgi:hypothetical protein